MVLFSIDLLSRTSTYVVQRRAVRVVIERDGLYLMVTSRYGDVKFPGGGQSIGESDSQTASRELLEETGYTLDPSACALIGEVEEQRQGLEEDTALVMISAYYRASLLKEVPALPSLEGYEEDYDYHVIWVTLDQALSMNQHAYQQHPDKVPW